MYLAEEVLEDNYEDVVKVTPILRATLDFLAARYATLPKRDGTFARGNGPAILRWFEQEGSNRRMT